MAKRIVDVLLRDLAGAIDLIGVDVFVQVTPQLREEPFRQRGVLRRLLRVGKNANRSRSGR